MKCRHKAGGADWLTVRNGFVKLHPYCEKCGTVKNVSSDRGKKIGYFMKCLSELRSKLRKKGYRVSDAQIRLISNELCRREEFEDTWWVSFSRQRELYVNTVKKYIRVSEEIIKESL